MAGLGRLRGLTGASSAWDDAYRQGPSEELDLLRIPPSSSVETPSPVWERGSPRSTTSIQLQTSPSAPTHGATRQSRAPRRAPAGVALQAGSVAHEREVR